MDKLINKICEMANIMQKSVNVDEDASAQDKERLTQLEIENKGLRELLEICSTSRFRILDEAVKSEKGCQTGEDDETPREGADGKVNLLAAEKQETEDDEKSGEKTPRNDEPS